ncbi:hypothetical protein FRC12_005808 [Ceratobasidium sp. 428]|nr:hypothetical protein FRC12_005808 [Ceratobasidium sp. 428]
MTLHSLGLTLVLSLITCAGIACGNTEIINFTSLSSPAVDVETKLTGVSWEKLDVESGTRQFELTLAPYRQAWSNVCEAEICEHEVFVKLELGEDRTNGFSILKQRPRYSLRISWPASTPVDFDVKAYTPAELHALLSSRSPGNSNDQSYSSSSPSSGQTRVMYAHIRARDAGVRAPPHRAWHFLPPLILPPSNPPTVSFHLVLDPLLLGFIPKSVMPTVWMLLAAVVIGVCLAGRLTTYLETIAVKANKQIRESKIADKAE